MEEEVLILRAEAERGRSDADKRAADYAEMEKAVIHMDKELQRLNACLEEAKEKATAAEASNKNNKIVVEDVKVTTGAAVACLVSAAGPLLLKAIVVLVFLFMGVIVQKTFDAI